MTIDYCYQTINCHLAWLLSITRLFLGHLGHLCVQISHVYKENEIIISSILADVVFVRSILKYSVTFKQPVVFLQSIE